MKIISVPFYSSAALDATLRLLSRLTEVTRPILKNRSTLASSLRLLTNPDVVCA
jgi:hypothetical protein